MQAISLSLVYAEDLGIGEHLFRQHFSPSVQQITFLTGGKVLSLDTIVIF